MSPLAAYNGRSDSCSRTNAGVWANPVSMMTAGNFSWSVDSVLPDLRAISRQQVFDALAAQTSLITGIDAQDFSARLAAVKTAQAKPASSDSSALLYDFRLSPLRRPFFLFARLVKPVVFDTRPVSRADLVFVQLSPTADGPHHLQRVFRLTRLLQDTRLLAALRCSPDTDSIADLLGASLAVSRAA